jgi:ABC-type transporter Mla subunit MlaD
MAGESRYFRIGLFLLLGLAVITIMAVVLGLGVFTRGTRPAESYFSYSVEGLNSGSPVMYRGVTIGSVTGIGLVNDTYPEATGPLQRFVLVRMALFDDSIRALTENDTENRFQEEIAKGLRVTVSVQLLTGEGTLQLDYLDPERNPVPPITWEPEILYIPSAPSTVSRVENMLIRFSDTLEDVDFDRLIGSITSMSESLARADIERLGKSLAETLEGTRSLVTTLNEIVSDQGVRRIVPRTAEILDTLEATMANLHEASTVLASVMTDPEFKQGLDRLPEILQTIHRAAVEVGQGAEILADAARNLDELTGDQRQRIDALLESLSRTARNFEELSEEARRNPSRFLFSEPPPRSPIDQ